MTYVDTTSELIRSWICVIDSSFPLHGGSHRQRCEALFKGVAGMTGAVVSKAYGAAIGESERWRRVVMQVMIMPLEFPVEWSHKEVDGPWDWLWVSGVSFGGGLRVWPKRAGESRHTTAAVGGVSLLWPVATWELQVQEGTVSHSLGQSRYQPASAVEENPPTCSVGLLHSR